VVLKVLLRINEILHVNKSYVIPAWGELNLEDLVKDLTLEVAAVEVVKEEPKKKKDTASSLFAAWDDD